MKHVACRVCGKVRRADAKGFPERHLPASAIMPLLIKMQGSGWRYLGWCPGSTLRQQKRFLALFPRHRPAYYLGGGS